MPTRSTRSWRRPLTSIYNDNYKYGSSLYSDTLQYIEKKYQDSMSRTHLRSDRPDLSLSTFSSSSLTAAPTSSNSAPSPSPTTNTRQSVLGSSSSETTSSKIQASIQQDLEIQDLEKKKEEQQRSFESFEARLNSVLRSALGDEEEVTKEPKEFRRARSLTEFDTNAIDTKKIRQRTTASEDRWEPPTTRNYSSTLANVPELPEEEPQQEETSTLRRRKRPPLEPETEEKTFDKTQFMSKCRDLQNQLDSLSRTVTEVEQRVKGEVTGTKNKIQSDLSDLSLSLEDTSNQAQDLQRVIKKQSSQLMELQNNYDEVQRTLHETTDQLGTTQRRCQSLKDELSSLRATVEQAGQTKISSRRF